MLLGVQSLRDAITDELYNISGSLRGEDKAKRGAFAATINEKIRGTMRYNVIL